jgi:hypothetical protein
MSAYLPDGKKCSETGLQYQDFGWDDFVEMLFSRPPEEPFAYQMKFLDELNKQQLTGLLGRSLINGVKLKYNKELAQMTPNEIDEIQKYYHSIGYEVQYRIEKIQKLPTDPIVNLFMIDFVPYKRNNDRINQPEKMI